MSSPVDKAAFALLCGRKDGRTAGDLGLEVDGSSSGSKGHREFALVGGSILAVTNQSVEAKGALPKLGGVQSPGR